MCSRALHGLIIRVIIGFILSWGWLGVVVCVVRGVLCCGVGLSVVGRG